MVDKPSGSVKYNSNIRFVVVACLNIDFTFKQHVCNNVLASPLMADYEYKYSFCLNITTNLRTIYTLDRIEII